MLEAVHRAGLGHRDDSHRVRPGAGLDFCGQAIEFWIAEVYDDVVGEAAGVQLDRAFREGSGGADGAVRQLLAQRPKLRIEPVGLPDQHPVDADRIHRLNTRGDDRIDRSSSPVRAELVQVDLRVDDLDLCGHDDHLPPDRMSAQGSHVSLVDPGFWPRPCYPHAASSLVPARCRDDPMPGPASLRLITPPTPTYS